MRVSNIEVHKIFPDYDPIQHYELTHYFHRQERTIYVAHTDTGLTGIGEGGSTASAEIIERYLGSNPFDWLGDQTSLGLGTAMYDLMGKAVGVPVYKLFGQKYRSWTPVSAWTVSTHPEHMARTVQAYAAQGHTWMKFHLSPFENVIDQTQAMQVVAPAEFRLHYDFTMHGTNDHMPELLDELSSYSIAGCFEDPLPGEDLQGYSELRQRSRLPIILHHFPMRATHEIFMRPADQYMLGHYTIGEAQQRAGLFAAGDMPFMLQNTGGQITRTMVAHMMAAFPTATLHAVSASETWKDDIVQSDLQVINGFVRVPETPGLGLELNRETLERLKNNTPQIHKPWILKSTYTNGTQRYDLVTPEKGHFLVRPDWSQAAPASFAAPLSTEYWDDDGSEEFSRMCQRLAQESTLLLGPQDTHAS